MCCGGVDKQLFRVLTQPSQFKLSPTKIRRLDANFLSLKDYVPREFPRKQRSASDSTRWKASEHSKCFAYTGIVAFENVLSPEQYNHYLTFAVAIMRILCSEELCLEFADYAGDLLKNVVSNSACLYGESFVGHNVHGLIHLAEDVKRYGSLYNFSAFPFESYLNVLKKKIRKSHKPLEQLVKRLAEVENQVKGQCKNADRNKAYIFKREHQNDLFPQTAMEFNSKKFGWGNGSCHGKQKQILVL